MADSGLIELFTFSIRAVKISRVSWKSFSSSSSAVSSSSAGAFAGAGASAGRGCSSLRSIVPSGRTVIV